jgi:hypothetical protein
MGLDCVEDADREALDEVQRELGLEKIRKAERVNDTLIGSRKRRFSLGPA